MLKRSSSRIVLVGAALVWMTVGSAWAQVAQPIGDIISFQGRLTDTSGKTLDNVTKNVSFGLVAVGGQTFNFPVLPVFVKGGVFTAFIDLRTASPTFTGFDPAKEYRMTVSVDGMGALPAQKITSVPMAQVAKTVPDGSVTSAKLSRSYFEDVLSSDVVMPSPEDWVTVLSRDIILDKETLVTVLSHVNMIPNIPDRSGSANLIVDGKIVGFSDALLHEHIYTTQTIMWVKKLPAGKHTILLQAIVRDGGTALATHPQGDMTRMYIILG